MLKLLEETFVAIAFLFMKQMQEGRTANRSIPSLVTLVQGTEELRTICQR